MSRVQFFDAWCFTDHDSGTDYLPFITIDGQVGYRCEREGDFTYFYLNASGGSDDGTATIFVYQDDDIGLLNTLHFYDVWDDEDGIPERNGMTQRIEADGTVISVKSAPGELRLTVARSIHQMPNLVVWPWNELDAGDGNGAPAPGDVIEVSGTHCFRNGTLALLADSLAFVSRARSAT